MNEKKSLKWTCPQCNKQLDDGYEDNIKGFFTLEEIEATGTIVLDKMTRNWHWQCWEEFKAEYNDHLDSQDINGKENGND